MCLFFENDGDFLRVISDTQGKFPPHSLNLKLPPHVRARRRVECPECVGFSPRHCHRNFLLINPWGRINNPGTLLQLRWIVVLIVGSNDQ